MKVLVVSATGYGCGIIPSLTREGHAVDICVNRLASELELPTTPPDFALFDSPIFKQLANHMRSMGIKVLGESDWSSILSTDVSYKTSLIEAIGYKRPAPGETGISATIMCIFNGQRFIARALVFNYTKMMAGDVGIDVSSSGYVVYFSQHKIPIVDTVLEPLERFLRKANHRGCFSVSVLANSNGVYVTDLSADINAPYVQAIFENSRRGRSDVLLDLFNENSHDIVFNDPYVCGVMLSIAPYPFSIPELPVSIDGINSGNLKHMWIIDLINDKQQWNCKQWRYCTVS